MQEQNTSMFKRILLEKRERLCEITKDIIKDDFRLDKQEMKDEMDHASQESQRSVHCRLRDRNVHLLERIDEALQRLEDGTFGICEECEEEISLNRLKARPTARLCIDCKEEQERMEKIIGDYEELRFERLYVS